MKNNDHKRPDLLVKGLKDASHLYEVEHRAYHLERPGFRISELQISPDSVGTLALSQLRAGYLLCN
jgi:hypothetical protein